MKVLQKQKQKRNGRQAGWLRQRLQKLAFWLSGKKGVHYINGSQTLPPPLNRQEEEEVFSDLLSCEEPVKQSARQLLIEHNLRLVAHIMKKYYTQADDQEDLISIGTIGLIKAVNTFRADKGIRLATYASRCIENAILSQRNKWRLRWRKSHEPFWGKMVYVLLLRFQVLHGGVYQFQLLLRGAGQLPDIFQRLLGLELCQLLPKLLLCLR